MELIEARLPDLPRADLRAALATDVGRQRERNEDSVGAFVPDPAGVRPVDVALVVADGVGGHEGGGRASRFVVDAVRDTIGAQNGPIRDLPRWLDRLLQSIHAGLLSEAKASGKPTSLGSTATVAVLQGRSLTLAHVGDSRAYRLRNGRLEPLTDDDSWVAAQERAGVLAPGEAEADARKNILTQCLGIGRSLRVQTVEHSVSPGDRYLLCSDGLHGVVDDEDLLDALVDETDPGVVAAALVALANARGGPDNISAVVFDVGEVPRYARPTAGAAVGGAAGTERDTVPFPAPAPVGPRSAASTRASMIVTGLGLAVLTLGGGSLLALGRGPARAPIEAPPSGAAAVTDPARAPDTDASGTTAGPNIPASSDTALAPDTMAAADTTVARHGTADPDRGNASDTIAAVDTVPPADTLTDPDPAASPDTLAVPDTTASPDTLAAPDPAASSVPLNLPDPTASPDPRSVLRPDRPLAGGVLRAVARGRPVRSARPRPRRPSGRPGSIPERSDPMTDPDRTQQVVNPALARTVRIDPDQPPPPRADDPMRKTIVMNRPPEISAAAWLVADRGPNKGEVHRIDVERAILGADRSADIVVDDPHASEQHASLRFDQGTFTLTDLDSTNGTRVNDDPIQKRALADGDRVQLGGASWVFKCVVFQDD